MRMSGSHVLSSRLVSLAGCGIILSTDDYFYDSRGHYTFSPELLPEAHSYNQKRASEAVKERSKLIIIDNTNTAAWELKPYIELGVNNYYKVKIMEPNTDWKFKPRLLAQKNSHGVPKQKIELMLDRYEKGLTVENLLSLWKLRIPSPPPSPPPSPSPSPPPEEPPAQAVPDVEVAADDAGEETFNSDSDDNDETEQNTTMTPDPELIPLNPDVEEFIPETEIPPMLEDPLSQPQPEEIGELLTLFPHLTVEEVAEMYSNQTININLHSTFAVTLQEHFGDVAPPEYLGKLPQDQILNMDISLNLAKIFFTLWQQSVLAKLNDEKMLVNNNVSSPSPSPSFSHQHRPQSSYAAPAKTVLAPNAVAYYEDKMLSQAVKVESYCQPQHNLLRTFSGK